MVRVVRGGKLDETVMKGDEQCDVLRYEDCAWVGIIDSVLG
jgi:hypothetical protein